MSSETWIIFAIGIIAAATPPLVASQLKKYKIVDIPTVRSSHTKKTLRGGGIAPMIALLVGLIVMRIATAGGVDAQLTSIVLAGAVAVGSVGLIEDVRGLSVKARLLCQCIVAVGVTAAATPYAKVAPWVLLLAVIGYAGYVNIANFMDGIDGISGLHGLVAGGAYVIIATMLQVSWMVVCGAAIAIAFAAFLPWNLLGRGLFLGDVGSYLLGGGLAGICVVGIITGEPALVTLAPLAIYLADTSSTLAKRIWRRQKWSEPHKEHVYQRLSASGLGHLTAASVVAVFSALTTSVGLLQLSRHAVPTIWAALLMLVVVALYLSMPMALAAFRSQKMSVQK